MREQVLSGGIEITNFCNLNCIHCYVGDCDNPIFMEMEKIKYLIEQLILYKAEFIVISGGEPFSHPNILELIHLMGSVYSDIKFIIASNGTLLNDELIDVIKGYNNIEIQISLDGITKETHETQHGGGDFEYVTNVIKKLSALSRDRKIVRMTISRINYKECDRIADFAKQHNARVQYVFTCKVGRAKNNWDKLEMTVAQQIYANETILRYAKLHPEQKITAPRSVLSCPFENPNTLFGVDIHANGDVNICTCLDSEYIVGNAFEEPFIKLLNSPRIFELSEQINRRKQYLLQNECKDCLALNRCAQGCIGRAKFIGNEFGLDGECEFRKALLFKNFFFKREKTMEET